MRFHRIYLAPATGLVIVAGIVGCSSGSSSSAPSASATPSTSAASSSASPAASTPAAEIRANWEKFFNSATPQSQRIALLQDGSKFSSAVASFAGSPLASAVSAKVDSVKVTSSTAATVTYDLQAAGATVEKDATGNAVYQGGTWRVGDSSFCGLLREASSELNMKLPAACG